MISGLDSHGGLLGTWAKAATNLIHRRSNTPQKKWFHIGSVHFWRSIWGMVDAKLAISPHDFRTLPPHEILLNKRFHGGTDYQERLAICEWSCWSLSGSSASLISWARKTCWSWRGMEWSKDEIETLRDVINQMINHTTYCQWMGVKNNPQIVVYYSVLQYLPE